MKQKLGGFHAVHVPNLDPGLKAYQKGEVCVLVGTEKEFGGTNFEARWSHVRAHAAGRELTLEELRNVRTAFFPKDETVFTVIKPRRDYAGASDFIVHLWWTAERRVLPYLPDTGAGPLTRWQKAKRAWRLTLED